MRNWASDISNISILGNIDKIEYMAFANTLIEFIDLTRVNALERGALGNSIYRFPYE